MAIYHCSIKIIGRSSGRSAVACAAYRSGSKLYDEELQKQNDYTKKKGVVYSEVMLPENAPAEYADKEKLWNAVHQIEKASNAQLAREIEVGVPRELSREEQIKLGRDYAQENFVSKGMVVEMDFHDKGDGNPHIHYMLTTRGFKANGEWAAKEKKDYALDANGERIPIIDPATGEQKLDSRNRKQWQRITVQANDWNSQENAEIWRANWAAACNRYLSEEHQIDHRSYARQGVEQEPTVHEGYAAREMENRGELSERCEHNRQVRERNKLLAALKDEYERVSRGIARLKDKIQEHFEMRRLQKAGQSTGYGFVDDLLANATARSVATDYSPEVKELIGEHRRLLDKEKELRSDLQTAKSILAAEEKGSIYEVKLYEGHRKRLKERYGAEVDEQYPEKLNNTIKLAQRKQGEVLRRLNELRPDIDWAKKFEKELQNGRAYGD